MTRYNVDNDIKPNICCLSCVYDKQDSTAADGQRHQQAKAPIKPKVARPGPSQAAASVPRQRPRSASLNRRSATAMDVRDSGPDVGGRHGRPQSVAGYQEQRPPVQQAWAASGTRYSEPKAPRGKVGTCLMLIQLLLTTSCSSLDIYI